MEARDFLYRVLDQFPDDAGQMRIIRNIRFVRWRDESNGVLLLTIKRSSDYTYRWKISLPDGRRVVIGENSSQEINYHLSDVPSDDFFVEVFLRLS